MNKNNLAIILLVITMLTVVMVVKAQSGKKLEPVKSNAEQVAQVQPALVGTPQTSAPLGSRQGYRLVTDVLDSFGGASESASFRIPVNSGGQPSPAGLSASTNWGAEDGFVHASKVRHGDPNSDRIVNVGDAIYVLNYLFKGGPRPCPVEAGDANCNGVVDLGDAIYVLNYFFKGGPAPSC